MQEISDLNHYYKTDLLRKKNRNVRGFSLRSVQRFSQDNDLSS